MTCKDCAWCVFENKDGGYDHDKNVTENCFCVIQDLFTAVNVNDKACSDFQNDTECDLSYLR